MREIKMSFCLLKSGLCQSRVNLALRHFRIHIHHMYLHIRKYNMVQLERVIGLVIESED